MNTNTDIFDIMDRYLERAATPDEERELFSTLLRDEELSTEFQAQSQLRSTMNHDVTATIIPSDLYASIVESAQQASLLPVPLVGAASVATEWMIRSVMALATATTAAVATIATSVLISVPPSIPTTPAQHVAEAALTPQRAMAPLAMPDQEEKHEREERHKAVKTPRTTAPTTADVALINVAPLLVANPEDVVRTPHNNASTIVSIMEEANSLQTTPLASTLHLRLTQTPLTYHMYATRTALTSAPNVGLEAEYALDREHAVGAVLHNDVFPVGVVTSDTNVQQQYAMLWGGASYRYTPQWNMPLGLQPFAQLNLGGSSRGVVVQPTLGLQIHVNQISISAGANMMTLFYQNSGAWNAASRVGVLVGIGYHL